MSNEATHAKENSFIHNLNISPRGPANHTLEDILAFKGDKNYLGQAQVTEDEQKNINDPQDNSMNMHLKEFVKAKQKKK